ERARPPVPPRVRRRRVAAGRRPDVRHRGGAHRRAARGARPGPGRGAVTPGGSVSRMPLPAPSRLLLAGRDAARLAADLAGALPAVETRTVAHGDLTPEDAAWAEGYCGFTVPANLAASGVRWVHLPMAGVDRVAPALRGTDVVLTRTVGG